MPEDTLRPHRPAAAFASLYVAGFAIAVRDLESAGKWSPRERAFTGVTGSGYLSLPCLPHGHGEAPGDIVFHPWLEVVSEVRFPDTQISLEKARTLNANVALGQSVSAAVRLDEDGLSQRLSDAALRVDWAIDLAAKGRVLVAFKDVTVRRVVGRKDAGDIISGAAVYPAAPRVPKRLIVDLAGFSVELTELSLSPRGAMADAVLTLPDNLGDATACGPATLDLGRVRIGRDCSIVVKRPDQPWGPWIVGDTGLVAEGTGYVFDTSATRGVPGNLPGWIGLALSGGSASGATTIPDPCNTGWLGGNFALSGALVTPGGLKGRLDLSGHHQFKTLNPLGYGVRLDGARLDLAASSITGGTLGPGKIDLPKEALRDPGGGGVTVKFNALNVQASLDVTGELSWAVRMAWGEFTHPGHELVVQRTEAKEGLVFLPTGPRASFRPVRPSGYVSLPYGGLVANGLAALDAEDAAGVTFRQLEGLSVLSPDRPGGLPLDFNQATGWLRADTLGLDGEIWMRARTGREALGEPARPGYVGGTPFDAEFVHQEKLNLAGRWVSSANSDSDFGGTINLPSPSKIPDLSFKDLRLTSTGALVGGIVGLAPGGVELDYWKVQLVPTGAPDESGVLSIRTGRIVFTSAGIAEPVHFAIPFRLLWGEILADGNIGDLRFDLGLQGQKFDGLPYTPSRISLSPYVAGTTDPYLGTCGTVHFNFFGPALVNIRDARHSDPAAPFFGRYVTVPATGEGACPATDLHLVGSWQNTKSEDLADFNFPNASMGYNDALQDGFVGTGAGSLRVLDGGLLDALIEARRDGIDIRLTSSATRDLNLGLYAVVGGMSEIRACLRIDGPLLRCMNLSAELESAVSTGSGILAPKAGHVVEVNMTVTPTSLDFFASGSILLQVAASAVDAYAQVHLQYDYQRGTAEGEVLGRIDCNSVVGGLEGEGQVTWFAGPGTGHMQGNIRVCVAGWVGKGAMEGGFFVGHHTPKALAWVLQPSSPHFGISQAILPDTLTGVFGYGQIAIGFNAYLFGGGVEIYAGAGAFTTIPSGYTSEWAALPGAVLPYVVGSCGVHLHGEILGGLVSASGWADLDLRGPVPVYYEGSLGLEGCVLWVLCASVELRVGLNSGGFYVA
jgi:hypothetical protein